VVNREEEQKRQELLKAIHTAKTLEEARSTLQAVREWMEKHPDDFAVAMAAEGLYMYYTALQRTKG